MRPILFAFLFLAAPALADTLAGRVVKIADGDTLTILVADNEQKRIRLSEVTARAGPAPPYPIAGP